MIEERLRIVRQLSWGPGPCTHFGCYLSETFVIAIDAIICTAVANALIFEVVWFNTSEKDADCYKPFNFVRIGICVCIL